MNGGGTSKTYRRGLIRASQLPPGVSGARLGVHQLWETKKKILPIKNKVPIWVLPDLAVNILGHALFTTGQINQPIGMILKKDIQENESHMSHTERCIERFKIQYQEMLKRLEDILRDYKENTIKIVFVIGRPVSPHAWISLNLPITGSFDDPHKVSAHDLPSRYTRMIITSIMNTQWNPKIAMAGVLPGRILVPPTEKYIKDGTMAIFRRKKYFGTGVEINLILEGSHTGAEDIETIDDSGLVDLKALEDDMMCIGILKGFS